MISGISVRTKKALTYFFILAILFGVYCYRESGLGNSPESEQVVAGEKINNDVGKTKIYFLDVGQGDAILTVFVNGEKMLIDCGANASVLEALGRVLKFGDRHIDYLLITHPDLDHYGGCIDVFGRFDVENFVYNGMTKNSDKYFREFWSALENEKATIEIIDHEDTWNVANTNLHFLFPDEPLPAKLDDTNAGSIVLKMSVGESDVLFMGDASSEIEKYLLNKYGTILDSEILKIGHHGSTSASGEDFLRTVTPDYSVISVGAGNRYGHPSERVLKRIERVNSSVLRTDLKGDIEMDLTSTNVKWNE
ncbi:MAG TPA: MBL fold metallo-hydrolase [Candidatus Magasanikbacteria bacterium]|nr:MBL fold metallo-hydrolase [Candidatus Magasanikbacteria bacterium]